MINDLKSRSKQIFFSEYFSLSDVFQTTVLYFTDTKSKILSLIDKTLKWRLLAQQVHCNDLGKLEQNTKKFTRKYETTKMHLDVKIFKLDKKYV